PAPRSQPARCLRAPVNEYDALQYLPDPVLPAQKVGEELNKISSPRLRPILARRLLHEMRSIAHLLLLRIPIPQSINHQSSPECRTPRNGLDLLAPNRHTACIELQPAC